MQDIESQHAVALENLLTERFGLRMAGGSLCARHPGPRSLRGGGAMAGPARRGIRRNRPARRGARRNRPASRERRRASRAR